MASRFNVGGINRIRDRASVLGFSGASSGSVHRVRSVVGGHGIRVSPVTGVARGAGSFSMEGSEEVPRTGRTNISRAVVIYFIRASTDGGAKQDGDIILVVFVTRFR